ncbi:DUF3006 domain-containing protein [Candidatus Berkelbacteria bacterium]|nr:DUF3006 domain-containing protein [Candidatus Berkelbacteria bacterium]
MARPHPLQLRGVIDRFEGHRVVILFEDTEVFGPLAGQELVLPSRIIPPGLGQGDMLVFEMMTDEQATEQRESVARKVLEEILNGE